MSVSVDGTLSKLSRIPGESDDEPMYFDVEAGVSSQGRGRPAVAAPSDNLPRAVEPPSRRSTDTALVEVIVNVVLTSPDDLHRRSTDRL